MTNQAIKAAPILPGSKAEALMQELSSWENTTTIILHGECVFEFKGIFPRGNKAEGYLNLESSGNGFEGHIKLLAIDHIAFQSRAHRGRESHAFVFNDSKGNVIFKVFLGRDTQGHLLENQLAAFNTIQTNLAL